MNWIVGITSFEKIVFCVRWQLFQFLLALYPGGSSGVRRVIRKGVPVRPAPDLGEHTEEVLTALGFGADDIGTLRNDEAIPRRQ